MRSPDKVHPDVSGDNWIRDSSDLRSEAGEDGPHAAAAAEATGFRGGGRGVGDETEALEEADLKEQSRNELWRNGKN